MRWLALTMSIVLGAASAPARADDGDFCVDRPGLGTPACTMAPGHAMIELGLGEWDHTSDAATIEDDLTFGDVNLRVGLDETTEFGAGLVTYTLIRLRDRGDGAVSRSGGVGDATLALRHSLSGPNGSVAIHMFVTLPTGRGGLGAGDWSAGVLVPIEFSLPRGLVLELNPAINAAVDADGHGRHLAFGGVIGLSRALGPNLSLSVELAVQQNNDPARQSTDARGALSLAWQAGRDWQFDLEVDQGFAATAPRHALMVGLARRF